MPDQRSVNALFREWRNHINDDRTRLLKEQEDDDDTWGGEATVKAAAKKQATKAKTSKEQIVVPDFDNPKHKQAATNYWRRLVLYNSKYGHAAGGSPWTMGRDDINYYSNNIKTGLIKILFDARRGEDKNISVRELPGGMGDLLKRYKNINDLVKADGGAVANKLLDSLDPGTYNKLTKRYQNTVLSNFNKKYKNLDRLRNSGNRGGDRGQIWKLVDAKSNFDKTGNLGGFTKSSSWTDHGTELKSDREKLADKIYKFTGIHPLKHPTEWNIASKQALQSPTGRGTSFSNWKGTGGQKVPVRATSDATRDLLRQRQASNLFDIDVKTRQSTGMGRSGDLYAPPSKVVDMWNRARSNEKVWNDINQSTQKGNLNDKQKTYITNWGNQRITDLKFNANEDATAAGEAWFKNSVLKNMVSQHKARRDGQPEPEFDYSDLFDVKKPNKNLFNAVQFDDDVKERIETAHLEKEAERQSAFVKAAADTITGAEKIASDYTKEKKYGKDYKSKGKFLRRYKGLKDTFDFTQFYDLADQHGISGKLGKYGRGKDGKDFKFGGAHAKALKALVKKSETDPNVKLPQSIVDAHELISGSRSSYRPRKKTKIKGLTTPPKPVIKPPVTPVAAPSAKVKPDVPPAPTTPPKPKHTHVNIHGQPSDDKGRPVNENKMKNIYSNWKTFLS